MNVDKDFAGTLICLEIMAHDEYIQEIYDLVYRIYNKVDFFIDKCTELNHLHIDYMSLIGQMSMTDLEDIKNLQELEHLVLNTYF